MESTHRSLGFLANRIERGLATATDTPQHSSDSKICPMCRMGRGTGWIVGEKGARPCKCRRLTVARRMLSVIPPKFRWANIHTLKAREDIHPTQKALVRAIKNNPLRSYLLCGRNGVGKTRMGFALYRNAVTVGRRAVAITVRALLDQYRKAELSERDPETGEVKYFRPAVTADDLRILNGPKWTLFLEEFDKASASEYAAQEMFELLNSASEYGHQLVVTTNLTIPELSDHWSRMSRTYGPSIIRRLEDAVLVEMF